MSCIDRGAIFRENAGFSKNVGTRGKVAAAGCLVAVQRGEVLDDLGAAAMAVKIAEATNVHQNVEPQRRASVEGAESLVVVAPMFQAQFNDFRGAGSGQAGDEVAELAVGVTAD